MVPGGEFLYALSGVDVWGCHLSPWQRILYGASGVASALGAMNDAAGMGMLGASGAEGAGKATQAGADVAAASQEVKASVTASNDAVKVIGRLTDTEVAKGWPGHDVLKVPTGKTWNLGMNDAWIQEGIDRGQTFYLASPINLSTLRSQEWRVTVYFRELKMLRDAGYYRVGDFMMPPGG